MRTTINLEKEKLSCLLSLTHIGNKSKAVRIAVEEFIRRERLKKIDCLRGRLSFDKRILKGRHYER